jgi:hypothetical protein
VLPGSCCAGCLLTPASATVAVHNAPQCLLQTYRVVEVGCGSGFVICSAALMLRAVAGSAHRHLLAVDHSAAALNATQQTLAAHGVSGHVHECSLCRSFTAHCFTLSRLPCMHRRIEASDSSSQCTVVQRHDACRWGLQSTYFKPTCALGGAPT